MLPGAVRLAFGEMPEDYMHEEASACVKTRLGRCFFLFLYVCLSAL